MEITAIAYEYPSGWGIYSPDCDAIGSGELLMDAMEDFMDDVRNYVPQGTKVRLVSKYSR